MSTEIFKVGDLVFDIRYEYGEVHDINCEYTVVSFDSCTVEYANEGYEIKLLSFTEYDLISGGWSQDRSVLNQPKKGDLVYVHMGDGIWDMRFYSHKEGIRFHCFNGQLKEGRTAEWSHLEVENPLLKEKETR